MNTKTDIFSATFPSAAVIAILILVLGAATLSNGCLKLKRPNLTRESFAFTAPPANKPPPGNGPILRIRRLGIAPPFDSQSFVYRTSEFSYEKDPYAQFLAPPNESLLQPIREYLRNTGDFKAVTEPESELEPTLGAEIYVNQMYGDFRVLKNPQAVLVMHVIFLDVSHGMPGKVLLQKEYARRIPIQSRTAAAVIAGWQEAMQQILSEAASDLAARNGKATGS